MIRNIAGREISGPNTGVTIGKTLIPSLSMSYGDNVEAEWIYEMGTQIPVADTDGVYKPVDGKWKVRGMIYRSIIVPSLPRLGAANTRTVAVVNFNVPGAGTDSDALYDFRIMGASVSPENSAKAQEVEISVRYRYVAWTSKRRVFGNPNGAGSVGSFNL